MTADIVIRGGLIVDGTGADPFVGDLAIRDGIITAIGAEADGGLKSISAAREVDARGKVVAPGWVDIHTHLDAQVTWDPSLEPITSNGVTTVVLGNCGVGFAPVRASQRRFLMELMEGVEDIPLGSLEMGIDWQWETFEEFLQFLDRTPLGCDVACMVGHGAVRAWVLGERANLSDRPGGPVNDPVTPAEMQAIADIVRDAVAAGAVGFSTSRTLLHRDKSGVLVPGTLAGEQELLAIARGMREGGGGVFEMASDFMAHDDQPHSPEDHAARLAHFAREWVWMQKVAKGYGVPLCFCLGIPSQEGPMQNGYRQMLNDTAQARASGANMSIQVFTRPQGILMNWESKSHPFLECPSFLALKTAAARAGGKLDKAALASDPELRARILAEASALAEANVSEFHFGIALPQSTDDEAESLAGNLNGSLSGKGALARMVRDGAMFTFKWEPTYEPNMDQSALAVARARGMDGPGDALSVVYEWLCEDGGDGVVTLVFMNYSSGDLRATHEMLTHPVTVPGLGDAGAHLGFICDNASHSFLLTHWVRDRAQGLPRLTLAEAVKLHTTDTARVFGFMDRGALRVGMRADINVIDLEGLHVHKPRLVSDLPKGAQRWIQTVEGYDMTICAGVVTHERDMPTGALPGRLLRNPGTFATKGSLLAQKLGIADAPDAPYETVSGRIGMMLSTMQWEARAQATKVLARVLGADRLETLGLMLYSKPLPHVANL